MLATLSAIAVVMLICGWFDAKRITRLAKAPVPAWPIRESMETSLENYGPDETNAALDRILADIREQDEQREREAWDERNCGDRWE